MSFGEEKKLEMKTRKCNLHGGLSEKLGFGPRVWRLKMIRLGRFWFREGLGFNHFGEVITTKGVFTPNRGIVLSLF